MRGRRACFRGRDLHLGEEFVVNSLGIELQETSTLMHASIETIARAEDVATGSEFQNSRGFQRYLENVGKGSRRDGRSSLGGAKPKSGTFDVLLRPLAVVELLESTLFPLFLRIMCKRAAQLLEDG